MKRIEDYEKEIESVARSYLRNKVGSGRMYLCGKSGMGKTLLARKYAKDHDSLYFSFRNLDASLAPRIFLPGCNNWDEFFHAIPETKNRPVIFFDDMDDRNDKDIFLENLPLLETEAFVVLIYRSEGNLPEKAKTLTMKPLTPHQLQRGDHKLEQIDALRIIAMTDGIPALASLFQPGKSSEENVRSIFMAGSSYLRYAEEKLHQEFRSPESYNTLLYGMAVGLNRISQLAEFSGYPKNKCDKYLKALDAAGFTETEQRKDDAGQIRTHYFLKGGYLRVWYQLYFPNQDKFYELLSDDALKDLIRQIDDCATKYYFRKICWRWFSRNAYSYYSEGPVAIRNPAQHNLIVGDAHLDFVQYDKNRDLYIKIWDDMESGFPKNVFLEIEAATIKKRPFYNNIYFVFSIRRVCNYIEDMQGLGTVAVVDLNTLLGKKNEALFENEPYAIE